MTDSHKPQPLQSLTPGMAILVQGDSYVSVSQELADAFTPGDSLLTTDDGQLIHVRKADKEAAAKAVEDAYIAFDRLAQNSQQQVTTFFEQFAAILENDTTFAPIAAANERDVADAKRRGRSTTRLVLSPTMRADMAAGLRGWAAIKPTIGEVLSQNSHSTDDIWTVERVRDRLGVVGFVFEGRPNVFADACGVLRSGNTVVFRIGSDALGTAQAIMKHAVTPALEQSGLPQGIVSLVESTSRESGYALVSDPRLSLAVVRGSGRAVSMLGSVATRAGNNTSLHGRGGAWIITGNEVDTNWFANSIISSLDRKVCNTLNTVVIPRADVDTLLPVALEAIVAAGNQLGFASKIHATNEAYEAIDRLELTGKITGKTLTQAGKNDLSAEDALVVGTFCDQLISVGRASGLVTEKRVERIDDGNIGDEWEWEDSPEVTIAIADSVEHAFELYNQYSPHFVVSYIDNDAQARATFEQTVNAPFIGNAFTRWVDGQYALHEPELGLGNWENGRLLARGGLLTGNSVYSVRTRATVTDGAQKR